MEAQKMSDSFYFRLIFFCTEVNSSNLLTCCTLYIKGALAPRPKSITPDSDCYLHALCDVAQLSAGLNAPRLRRCFSMFQQDS